MRAVVLVVCSLAAISPARADDKAKAKALYEEGLRHYNLAEYAEAIRPWKDAYLLTKRPLLLFNIGQAYRLSGDCAQAMTFYDSYTREQPSPKNQGELEDAQALCRDKLAAKPPVTPPIAPAVSEPVTPPSPMPPPQTQPPNTGRRTLGLIIGAAGVAVGGTAIYFGLSASNEADDLDNFRGEWGPEQRAKEERGLRDQKLALGLGITGVGAIGVGVVLVLLGASSSESSVAVMPARGGGELSWTMHY